MHFIDEASIEVIAGKGGHGCLSFLRARNLPKGGPDGGNGGKGGSVYLRVEHGLNTLVNYRFNRKFSAQNGRPGQGSQKTGASGEDLYLPVPQGLNIFDEQTNTKLGELVKQDDTLCVAIGGNYGLGNMCFTSSTNRTPYKTTEGTLGEQRQLRLELQLLADIGLVGMPNAGKSSLISKLSAAKPRIADYPFTTLVPQLGVVRSKGMEAVVADIPGLIAGSSQGKGLGDRFLRHINRTSLLWHLVDVTPLDDSDPLENFAKITQELAQSPYPKLSSMPVWILLNKCDQISDDAAEALAKRVKERYSDIPVFCTSNYTAQNHQTLVNKALHYLQTQKERDKLCQNPPADPG